MPRTCPTISLCMIVRDEESHLADCLTPVAALMDEIIVVDTGSRDATKEIAGRFTSQVFDFPWNDDFSAARNASLARASGKWILWLDADDRLKQDNVARLATLIGQLGDQPRCFFMNTVLHRSVAYDGAPLHSQLRLFRRHPEHHWRGRVHEQLRPESAELGYDVVWTDIQIEHLGYTSPVETQRKLRRNLRLLNMDYAIDPSDLSTLFHLGLTHAELDNRALARNFLQQVIAAEHRGWEPAAHVYHTLAELALKDGDAQQALQVLAQGRRQLPGSDLLLYKQAEVLLSAGFCAEAEACFQQLMQSPSPRSDAAEIRQRLAPRKIAQHLVAQRRYKEALPIIRLILRDSPDDTRTWYLLGSMYVCRPDKAELSAVCQRLRTCHQGDFFANALEAGWHLCQRDLHSAATFIDLLLAEMPQSPLGHSFRCQLLAMQRAPRAARLAACRDWLWSEPGNAKAAQELRMLESADRGPPLSSMADWCTSIVCSPFLPAAGAVV